MLASSDPDQGHLFGRGASAPASLPAVAPLTEVWRGGVVESRHRGTIAVVDARGRLLYRVGDPDLRTFWRSAAKPLQALPVVETGSADHFGLLPQHLAVFCASHAGRSYHVEAVLGALAKAGVSESALRCEIGGQPSAAHGCSGNHAGMLVTAAHLGEPVAGYERFGHPAQVRIRETLATLVDLAPGDVEMAGDGCGVPTFAMTIRQMALAYARLVDPRSLRPGLQAAAGRIVAAMREHPDLLAGAVGDTGNITSALVRLKGALLVAKTGAEALLCAGIRPGVLGPDGVGVAVKAEDGGSAPRSCYLAMAEALRQLGVVSDAEMASLAPYLVREIRNGLGAVIGGARPCFELTAGVER